MLFKGEKVMEAFSSTCLPTKILSASYFKMFLLETTEVLAFSVSKKGEKNVIMGCYPCPISLSLGRLQRKGNIPF